ncbi:hypothetical protein D3C72_1603760 [compost metagenome]
MAGTVSRGAGALHGLLTVVGGVAAERALVDGAVGVAVERHAEVFELVHDLGRFAAHELDGVLVAQPVGALDGVVEVVVPVVLGHVAQRCGDAALCRHGVRTGGEHFGQRCHVQACAGEFKRGTHAGAACADDDDVKLAAGDVSVGVAHYFLPSVAGINQRRHKTWIPQPAQPTSQTMLNTCSARRRPTGLM